MRLRRIALSLSVLLILSSFACIKRVERPIKADYSKFFPLADGNYYVYSGPEGKAMITQSIGDLYTFTHYDAAGKIIFWKDFLRTDHTIGWQNIVFSLSKARPLTGKSNIPDIHFEPPLPFLPWTEKVGDTILFSSAEIRHDSVNTHLRLQIEYTIDGIASVNTPAGMFNDCIEIKMTHKILYDKEKNFLEGDSYWWFARNVGVVKYITPEGAGELLQAKVDGKTYP